MKRNVKVLGVTFGAAALLSLGAACSTRQTPAPSVGATAPSSEPSTTPSGQPGGTSEIPKAGSEGTLSQQGQQGQWSPQGQQAPQPPQPPQAQPGTEPQQGALGSGLGETGAQPQTGGSEKALCEALAGGAKLHVEDVQNGFAIVAVPKQGTNLASVRDEARKLESSIHGAEGMRAGAQPGETCGIAQLGRLPSVTTTITEGASSVRIMMTTSNSGEVKDLRKIARDEVGALAKPAGK